jgi:hypothetical protein
VTASQSSVTRLSAIDPLFEDGGWLEHHRPPGRYRHLLTGLGIAAHALALLAHDKRAERRQLDRFASFQTIGDFLEHKLYKCGGFGSRQAESAADGPYRLS